MKPRQSSIPERWFVADVRAGSDLWPAVRRLPPGSGVLLLYRDLPARERERLRTKLRRIARQRRLLVIDEAAGEGVRVHDIGEVRRAARARTPLLFLSPIFPTRSHPDWRPLQRLKAAALIRLSRVPVIALGGMNGNRFRRVRRLGFQGWAGIDAWIRT